MLVDALGARINQKSYQLPQSKYIMQFNRKRLKTQKAKHVYKECKTCKTSLLESTTIPNPSLTSFSSDGGRSKTSYWVKSLDLGFPVATNKMSRGNAVVQAICPLDTSYMRSTMSCLHTSTASVAFLARVV